MSPDRLYLPIKNAVSSSRDSRRPLLVAPRGQGRGLSGSVRRQVLAPPEAFDVSRTRSPGRLHSRPHSQRGRSGVDGGGEGIYVAANPRKAIFMLRWNAQFLSLLVCIVPPLVFPATPASALPNPPVLVQQSTVAMHYGLDVQRAKAAGQKIREDNGVTVVSDASGKEVMRFDSKRKLSTTPNGVSTGDCGQSSVWVYAGSGSNYRVLTGFTLFRSTSWWVDWKVDGVVRAGSSIVDRTSWSNNQPIGPTSTWMITRYGASPRTPVRVDVRVSHGIAWIVGGIFCTAGNPVDSTKVG